MTAFEIAQFIALNIVVPVGLVGGISLLVYAASELGRIQREQKERDK